MKRYLKKRGSKLGSGKASTSFYVVRDSKGHIKKWVKVGSSLKADKRRKSSNKPKRKGRGHKGDY